MKLIADYVEDVKEKTGVKSDRALSMHLGGGESLVSKWINEGKHPEDYYCIKMAQILGINPLEIIAAANWEREKIQEKKDWWEDFRKAQSKQAGSVHILMPPLFLHSPSVLGSLLSMYYVKKMVARRTKIN
jgi:hypothetical protein